MPTPLQNINAEKIQGNLSITSVSATTYYNLPTSGGAFTGGTVSGATIFTGGLTANTISATTYFNLPIDIRVTGGTYTTGTATFTNNTGGTFNVSGFSTGTSSTDIYVTGSTYSNNNFLFTNNTGGTFNVLFNTVTGLTVNGNLTVTGNTNIKGLTATSATLSGSGSNVLTIIGSGDTSNPIFTIQNLSGNTLFSVADYTSGPLFWVDSFNGSPILEVNDFSPQLIVYGSLSATSIYGNNIYVTGGTQSLFSGNSSVELVKIIQNGSGDAFVVEDVANGDASHFVINASGNTAIGLTQPLNGDKLTVSGNTTIYGTLSATTYVGLPIDIRITGGTYTAGTATFTNNTGGTFSVSGFSSGGGSSSGVWGISNSGGTYTYYATWALAVAAAASGQVIELFADITENSVSYTLKNGVNINGNGHTVTSTMGGTTACLTDGGVTVICDISNITINKTTGVGVSITNTSSIITGNCILKGVDLSSASLTLYGQLSGWSIMGASRYPVDMFSTAILTNVYINTTETGATAIVTNASTIKINNCVIKSSGSGIGSAGGIISNCTLNTNSGGISCTTGEVNNCSIITNTLAALTLGANSSANNCYARSASGVACGGVASSTFNNCEIVTDANVTGNATPNYYNCKLWSKADWVLNGGGGGKIVNCTIISNYNGPVIREVTTGTYIIDCYFEVTNSAATPIYSTSTPTLYIKGNSVKGTTNLKSAGIINGQTNTADAQGNIILQ